MFNLGFVEIIVIVAVGLIVLGPEKFPKAARQTVRFFNELKRAFIEIKSGFDDIQEETQKVIEEAKKGAGLEDIQTEFSGIQEKAQKIKEEIHSAFSGEKEGAEKSKRKSPISETQEASPPQTEKMNLNKEKKTPHE